MSPAGLDFDSLGGRGHRMPPIFNNKAINGAVSHSVEPPGGQQSGSPDPMSLSHAALSAAGLHSDALREGEKGT